MYRKASSCYRSSDRTLLWKRYSTGLWSSETCAVHLRQMRSQSEVKFSLAQAFIFAVHGHATGGEGRSKAYVAQATLDVAARHPCNMPGN